jgi:hypothetical protein
MHPLPRRTVVVLLTALAFAARLGAQSVGTSPEITEADLRSRLFRIADDSLAGRMTGTIGNFKAAAYVAAEFQRLGLEPAGEHGTWFQEVPFFTLVPADSAITVAGGGTLRYGADFALVGGRPGTSAWRFDATPAIYGGTASDTGTWISPEQAAGKVVVLDVRAAPGQARSLDLTIGRVFAARRFAGAAAVAVAELDLFVGGAPTAPNWRPVLAADTMARLPAGPVRLLLTPKGAERLFGAPVAGIVPGRPGRSLTGDISLHWAPVAYPARNVIGILRGRDPARRNTYLSITAHNDHVGICGRPVDHDSIRAFNRVVRPMGADSRVYSATPEQQARIGRILDSLRRIRPPRADSICNGADDDGTGTAAILELAESFASLPSAQRPARSLLFVSHAAEEVGLVGSAWFTDHPTVPLDSVVAEIDEDMVGRGTAQDLPEAGPSYLEVIGSHRLSNEFGELLEAANAAQPRPFVFNYAYDAPGHPLQYYCRADHYSYARYGIPSVAFSRGEHLDYHQVTDEAQYIDYPDFTRVVRMVRDAVMRIADLDHFPKLDRPKGDPHARCVQ